MKLDATQVAHQLTGIPASQARPLGGAAYLVVLENGERLVAKSHGEPNAVKAEAASLEWLSQPAVVPVPGLRALSDEWLLTDYIEPGASGPEAAEELGRGLARLHASGAPAFGSPPVGGPREASIGLAEMYNVECETWPDFYANHRVEPYLRTAVDRASLTDSQARTFGQVLGRLDDLAGPAEPPARLHGDLWSGNVLWSAQGPAWLIDPAAHGGHRETDLAMLHLFGCSYLDRLLGAYQEVAPLADGWRHRIPLHQLFPLLVHTVLFGGAYAGQAAGAARAALAA